MKKKIFIALSLFIVICCFYLQTKINIDQDLNLDNIEAIASGENQNGCPSGGSYKCNGSASYVYYTNN